MEDQKIKNYKKKKPLSGSFYTKIYVLLGLVLIVFTFYNIVQGASFGSKYSLEVLKAEQFSKPAEINLITIKDLSCKNCFNIDLTTDSLKKANVKILKEEVLDLKSTTAKQLIDKYSIETLPAIIVTGEVNKVNVKDLDKKENALLFTKALPPYTDAKTSEIKGLVTVTVLKDASCTECSDFTQVINALKQSGVKVVLEKVLEKNEKEGNDLIKNYDIKFLPSIIISSDLKVYKSDITKNWDSVGTIESDGTYVARIATPPFVNLSTNKVEGLVSLITLVDKSCTECYNPEEVHKPILKGMGIVFSEEKTLDVSSIEGKALIDKYNIEKVPTIILSGGVEKYPALIGVWPEVGTVEPNGMYVFRSVELLGNGIKYKNLNTGEVIA